MLTPLDPDLAARLEAKHGAGSAEHILVAAFETFEARLAIIVSSFGAEAAVLLPLATRLDPAVTVILLNTGLLFAETLEYQTHLTAQVGLTDVRRVKPDEAHDPDRSVHVLDSQACCRLRKVEPQQRALAGFNAVATGRKRFQTAARRDMTAFETDKAGRVRVNPLLR